MSKVLKYPTPKTMKICIVGPKCSGKTALARALAGAAWESGRRYTPTVGVRIQEILKDKSTTLELWDCSGDDKFEACRPAMANNVQGLLLVYNITAPKQKQELEKWYQEFGVAKALPNSVCQIIGTDLGFNSPTTHGMDGKLASLPQTVICLKDPNTHARLLKVLEGLLQNILKQM